MSGVDWLGRMGPHIFVVGPCDRCYPIFDCFHHILKGPKARDPVSSSPICLTSHSTQISEMVKKYICFWKNCCLKQNSFHGWILLISKIYYISIVVYKSMLLII